VLLHKPAAEYLVVAQTQLKKPRTAHHSTSQHITAHHSTAQQLSTNASVELSHGSWPQEIHCGRKIRTSGCCSRTSTARIQAQARTGKEGHSAVEGDMVPLRADTVPLGRIVWYFECAKGKCRRRVTSLNHAHRRVTPLNPVHRRGAGAICDTLSMRAHVSEKRVEQVPGWSLNVWVCTYHVVSDVTTHLARGVHCDHSSGQRGYILTAR
jgi:hypothetical protein